MKRLLIILLLTLVAFSSCNKDKGEEMYNDDNCLVVRHKQIVSRVGIGASHELTLIKKDQSNSGATLTNIETVRVSEEEYNRYNSDDLYCR